MLLNDLPRLGQQEELRKEANSGSPLWGQRVLSVARGLAWAWRAGADWAVWVGFGAGTLGDSAGAMGMMGGPRMSGVSRCAQTTFPTPLHTAEAFLPCSLPSHQGDANKTWLLVRKMRPKHAFSCLKHIKAFSRLINIKDLRLKGFNNSTSPLLVPTVVELWAVLGGERIIAKSRTEARAELEAHSRPRVNASWFSHPAVWRWPGKGTFFCRGENNFVFVLC